MSGGPVLHDNLAYHFENEKLVRYLEGYAQGLGVVVRDDTVESVRRDEGGVAGLVLASGQVAVADLYVDCSGFASALLSAAMGEPHVDYGASLFCDRAVVGGWDRSNEPIHPYTTCETMPDGWLWQIEHERRINCGYVYSSGFVSDTDAEAEFRCAAGGRLRPRREVPQRPLRAGVGRECGGDR